MRWPWVTMVGLVVMVVALQIQVMRLDARLDRMFPRVEYHGGPWKTVNCELTNPPRCSDW